MGKILVILNLCENFEKNVKIEEKNGNFENSKYLKTYINLIKNTCQNWHLVNGWAVLA